MLLRTPVLSLAPYLRGRRGDELSYAPLVAIGDAMLFPDVRKHSGTTVTHSHSIINGICKPLSHLEVRSASSTFTVRFTVNFI